MLTNAAITPVPTSKVASVILLPVKSSNVPKTPTLEPLNSEFIISAFTAWSVSMPAVLCELNLQSMT